MNANLAAAAALKKRTQSTSNTTAIRKNKTLSDKNVGQYVSHLKRFALFLQEEYTNESYFKVSKGSELTLSVKSK